ncbi:hypothetical protein CSC2_14110 [Clostridium zeae]|uniref:Butirosin biosynthesis protein H N-terminal domain-containing protein n=1 Tax=Clostridium zeae TaxID=2759022 RepID=A0ABQ1E839_9CLOT|nr:BtrH N-terminal domain-containing protein [Clostridium zeae]GFZ30885.1 hypothetical protein CSC2_14110 [Clostridium zeae]
MIEKYKDIHRIGMHCETVAVRDIIHYYGTDLTFHDLLGLAGTLATFCCKPHSYNADVPYLSLSGYTSNITIDAANTLGLDVITYNYDTFENSFKLICEYVGNKIPVIVRLSYNEYAPKIYEQRPFSSEIEECVDINFGVHYIQILAFNEAEQCVYFAESDRPDIQSMPVQLLKNAMNAKAKEMPVENEFMVIMPPTKPITLGKNQILSSFQKMYLKTCNNFNFGDQAFVGVGGVEKFRKEFLEILNTCDEAYIRANVAWLLISTGAVFKSNILYKSSLKRYCDTAQKITNNIRFVNLSKIAGKLERSWRAFNNDLYNYIYDKEIDKLKYRIENMDDLMSLENEYSDELRNTMHTIFEDANIV